MFSTQDLIDRLGIVDTDQVRQIITPLREKGLIEKLYNRNQAYAESQKRHIPKRELPIWRVADVAKIGTPSNLPSRPVEVDEESLDEGKTHSLFIGAIPYRATKSQIVALLSDTCEVLELSLPPNKERRNENKGFAFAEVSYPGTTQALVNALGNKRIGIRLLTVRDNSSPVRSART